MPKQGVVGCGRTWSHAGAQKNDMSTLDVEENCQSRMAASNGNKNEVVKKNEGQKRGSVVINA
ncbi:hypothetical protein CVS40_2767 [Lucilia cuprina]|nr:hypothetical protein CVS40_2767 [Lucilia cuprina]